MRLLTGDTLGGYTARRLLPWAFAVPMLLGWLRLQGEQSGQYGAAFGVALMVVGSCAASAAIIILTMRRLDQVDAARRRASEETDMLERGRAELLRSNSALEQFAYAASHDLRQPLRLVLSFLSLLEERVAGKLDADERGFLRSAAQGASHMDALVKDLLEYARVGTAQFRRGTVDCEVPFSKAREALARRYAECGAALTHDPLPTLVADEGQLFQLFLNLLDNAVKFRGARPPQVHVGAERDGGAWRFSVRDNGIGIDPRQADRVFIIFQRLHGRKEYPGTGIGLAVCKKIAERHGGRIWFESTPGEGATFFFTVPDR